MPPAKVHAIRALPGGRFISRCSSKPNDWILSHDETRVTCERCVAALEFDRQAAAHLARLLARYEARDERRKFQQFLLRQKFVTQPHSEPGDEAL